MPTKRKSEPLADDVEEAPTVDIDALVEEAGGRPDLPPVVIRWQGRNWTMRNASLIDPRVLARGSAIESLDGMLREALSPADYAAFPFPTLATLGNDKTEVDLLVKAYFAASDEAESPGKSTA